MPLTKEQLAEINEGIKNAEALLKDAKADISTAKKAGIDVEDMDKQQKELALKIRQLKAVYGKP